MQAKVFTQMCMRPPAIQIRGRDGRRRKAGHRQRTRSLVREVLAQDL